MSATGIRTNRGGRHIAFLLFLYAAFVPAPAIAGVLDWAGTQGLSGAFAPPASHASGPADWFNPALLTASPKSLLSFESRTDDIYHLEKAGRVQYALDGDTRRASFLWALNPESPRARTVAGVERTTSRLRLFTDGKINGTSLNLGENAEVFTLGRQFHRLSVGFTRAADRWEGSGRSLFLAQRIPNLAAGASLDASASETRTLWQAAWRMGHWGALSRSELDTRVAAHLRLHDANDEFIYPVNMRMEGSETRWSGDLSRTHRASLFYQRARGESLDPILYNGMRIGLNHLYAGYDYRGLGLDRRLSRATTLSLGYEKYDARIQGAGYFNIVNAFFSWLGAYYRYHPVADIEYSDIRLGVRRTRGRTTLRAAYHYRPADVFLHWDGAQCSGLGVCSAQDVQEYVTESYIVHTLALGIDRKIGKSATLRFDVTQTAPTGGRAEEEPAAPAGAPGPAAPPQSRSVSGGRSFTLGYRVEF